VGLQAHRIRGALPGHQAQPLAITATVPSLCHREGSPARTAPAPPPASRPRHRDTSSTPPPSRSAGSGPRPASAERAGRSLADREVASEPRAGGWPRRRRDQAAPPWQPQAPLGRRTPAPQGRSRCRHAGKSDSGAVLSACSPEENFGPWPHVPLGYAFRCPSEENNPASLLEVSSVRRNVFSWSNQLVAGQPHL